MLVILNVGLFVIAFYAESFVPFILSRFIVGAMCGLFSGIGTIMYLSEIVLRNLRGSAGTLHQLSIVLGILSWNIFGLSSLFGQIKQWPLLFVFQLLPTLIQFICMPFCVETPKYVYIKKNDSLRARIIFSDDESASDINSLQVDDEDEYVCLLSNSIRSEKSKCQLESLLANINYRL